jgi:hypothetical protein
MHDEMTEFVGAVESASGPVVLVGGENHDWPVVKRQENASTSAVSGGVVCVTGGR